MEKILSKLEKKLLDDLEEQRSEMSNRKYRRERKRILRIKEISQDHLDLFSLEKDSLTGFKRSFKKYYEKTFAERGIPVEKHEMKHKQYYTESPKVNKKVRRDEKAKDDLKSEAEDKIIQKSKFEDSSSKFTEERPNVDFSDSENVVEDKIERYADQKIESTLTEKFKSDPESDNKKIGEEKSGKQIEKAPDFQDDQTFTKEKESSHQPKIIESQTEAASQKSKSEKEKPYELNRLFDSSMFIEEIQTLGDMTPGPKYFTKEEIEEDIFKIIEDEPEEEEERPRRCKFMKHCQDENRRKRKKKAKQVRKQKVEEEEEEDVKIEEPREQEALTIEEPRDQEELKVEVSNTPCDFEKESESSQNNYQIEVEVEVDHENKQLLINKKESSDTQKVDDDSEKEMIENKKNLDESEEESKAKDGNAGDIESGDSESANVSNQNNEENEQTVSHSEASEQTSDSDGSDENSEADSQSVDSEENSETISRSGETESGEKFESISQNVDSEEKNPEAKSEDKNPETVPDSNESMEKIPEFTPDSSESEAKISEEISQNEESYEIDKNPKPNIESEAKSPESNEKYEKPSFCFKKPESGSPKPKKENQETDFICEDNPSLIKARKKLRNPKNWGKY